MSLMASAGPGQCEEPENPFGSPAVTEDSSISVIIFCFSGMLTGSWILSGVASCAKSSSIWDSSVTGSQFEVLYHDVGSEKVLLKIIYLFKFSLKHTETEGCRKTKRRENFNPLIGSLHDCNK